MKTFSLYYLEKQLKDIVQNPVLSESVDLNELYTKGVLGKRKKALRLLLDKLKNKYIKSFYSKFPKIQYEDIQEAFEEAIKIITTEKPKSKTKIETLFKKTMNKTLSDLSRKKKKIRQNLSCLKVIKSSIGLESVSQLMKRAERILTHQEKKVIEFCSQGKSVRSMAKELGISAPTAWRSLNSGIDKLRLSHGMKSRKLG